MRLIRYMSTASIGFCLSAMLRAGVGAFLYSCCKKNKRLFGGNRFIANTIILDVSVKRIFKRIEFKRFVDQALLVCDDS